jgi:hypothetical protein
VNCLRDCGDGERGQKRLISVIQAIVLTDGGPIALASDPRGAGLPGPRVCAQQIAEILFGD